MPKNQRIGLRTRVVALIGAALICFLGFEAESIVSSRNDEVRETRTDVDNLAQSLVVQADDILQTAEIVSAGLNERVAHDGLSPDQAERLDSVIRRFLDTVPTLHSIEIVDANGRPIDPAGSAVPRLLAAADPGYLEYHRSHRDPRMVIGRPIPGPDGKGSLIVLSRRLDDASGGFAGVVIATIPSALFQSFYARFQLGNGSVTLGRTDGAILLRQPSDPTIPIVAPTDPKVMLDLAAAAQQGLIVSPFDKVTRYVAVRISEHYPLFVAVTHDRASALADWRRQTAWRLVFTAIGLAVLALLAVRLVRQIRERDKVMALYDLIARNSRDAVIRMGLDGRHRYLSPAFETLTGWPVEQLAGTSWLDYTPPADHPVLQRMLRALRAGSQSVDGRYRYRRRDGSDIWVELNARLVPGAGPQGGEFVGNIRDVTEARGTEENLAELNRRLTMLTLTDALTEVANRRKFDLTLAAEWQRAVRYGTSLALVMIDVDHFKLFNDSQGHQQGDQCLVSVARAISTCVRRSGDLVARYGGEEFCLILPSTGLGAAAKLAEQVRRAVADLKIRHPRHPAGIITVSLGIATEVPTREDRMETLIEAADRALYAAKSAGRNRVSTAQAARVASLAS